MKAWWKGAYLICLCNYPAWNASADTSAGVGDPDPTAGSQRFTAPAFRQPLTIVPSTPPGPSIRSLLISASHVLTLSPQRDNALSSCCTPPYAPFPSPLFRNSPPPPDLVPAMPPSSMPTPRHTLRCGTARPLPHTLPALPSLLPHLPNPSILPALLTMLH